jgi:hypothetical protein
MIIHLNAPEIRVQTLDTETPLERAQRRTDQARVLDGVIKSSWALVGILCRDVRRDRDWEIMGYGSFPAWREDVLPFSKSLACDAENLIGQLDGWKDDEIVELPYSTAKFVTTKIPKSRQTPELKKAARRMKPEAFEEQVISRNPDLHIERKVWVNLPLEESQKRVIKGALELCRELEQDETLSYSQFFEKLAAGYLNDHHKEAAIRMLRGK